MNKLSLLCFDHLIVCNAGFSQPLGGLVAEHKILAVL